MEFLAIMFCVLYMIGLCIFFFVKFMDEEIHALDFLFGLIVTIIMFEYFGGKL